MNNPPRICFLSTMCLLDPVSGAAHSVRNILETLASAGYSTSSFTASLFDKHDEVDRSRILGKQAGSPDAIGKILKLRRNGVDHHVFLTASSLGTKMPPDAQRDMLDLWRATVSKLKPDFILSFGSSHLSHALREIARDAGAKIVFYLGNAEVKSETLTKPGDRAVCPSRHLASLYAERFGIETAVLHPVISPDIIIPPGAGINAHPASRRLGFVTFVNPLPQKGLTLVAGLIDRARRERPDIKFLVLEGRMPRRLLQKLRLDLPSAPNVWWLPEQKDMAAIYARTSVMLVPSLWSEGFGRSVVEAQLSGIPVLASNRGGLVEALGDGPTPLPVDQACTENHNARPTPETLDLWWSRLIQLWDDDSAYSEASALARRASEPYAPEKARKRVLDHFEKLTAK